MCSAAANSFTALAVIRFFQGVIEASSYCGTLYVMGSWMKPQEIAKRTAIFSASGQAGTMFAGLMVGFWGLSSLAELTIMVSLDDGCTQWSRWPFRTLRLALGFHH